MSKHKKTKSLREQELLNSEETLYRASALLSALCFISSFASVQNFFYEIPPNKSQLFEVNGIIEADRRGKYNGIKVADFITGGKLGTSMISFVKGKAEISHNLPDSTSGLVFLLHAVQSF